MEIFSLNFIERSYTEVLCAQCIYLADKITGFLDKQNYFFVNIF